MNVILAVERVEPRDDYSLLLEFENHEKKVFSMKPYLEKYPYQALQNKKLFMKARIQYGTVVWSDEIDLAPDYLYERSIFL